MGGMCERNMVARGEARVRWERWSKCRGPWCELELLDSNRFGIGACFLSVGHRGVLKFFAIQYHYKLFGLNGRNLPAAE